MTTAARTDSPRRFNIVDISAAIIVLILIPAAFGSYLLFRGPQPKLLKVTPDRLYEGNAFNLEINGRDLRPFMRVSFGTVQARTFAIASTTSAQVELPELPVGAYDVVLYDYSREVDRLSKALTILPRPREGTVTIDVDGYFLDGSDALATQLKPGLTLPPTGGATAIVSTGSLRSVPLPLRFGSGILQIPADHPVVPATLRMPCSVKPAADGVLVCWSVGTQTSVAIAPNTTIDVQGPTGWLRFGVTAVHAATTSTVLAARVRFVAAAEILLRVKAGDVDFAAPATATARSASITAVSVPHAVAAGQAVDVTVHIPVDRAVDGWRYHGSVVKAGAPFTMETDRYLLQGEILDATPLPLNGETR